MYYLHVCCHEPLSYRIAFSFFIFYSVVAYKVLLEKHFENFKTSLHNPATYEWIVSNICYKKMLWKYSMIVAGEWVTCICAMRWNIFDYRVINVVFVILYFVKKTKTIYYNGSYQMKELLYKSSLSRMKHTYSNIIMINMITTWDYSCYISCRQCTLSGLDQKCLKLYLKLLVMRKKGETTKSKNKKANIQRFFIKP